MKIVHFTTVHPRNDTRVFDKQCTSLANHGNTVILLVADGKGEELRNNILIKDIGVPRNRLFRMTISSVKMFVRALGEKAHIYHFHDPELIPVALVLRAASRKVIYDVHEDLPKQILSKMWIGESLRPILAALVEHTETFCAKFMSAVIGATNPITTRFSVKRRETIFNYPKLSSLNILGGKPYTERSPVVVYIGSITDARGALEMLSAVSEIANKRKIRFLIGGKVQDPNIEKQFQEVLKTDEVEFLGWVDRSQIAAVLAQARVGLVVLKPIPNYLEALPVKLFEYMAAGLPVVVSDFPLWREIVTEADCGILVDPNNIEDIKSAIETILDKPEVSDEMGQRGKRIAYEKYDWNIEEKKLLQLYHRVVES